MFSGRRNSRSEDQQTRNNLYVCHPQNKKAVKEKSDIWACSAWWETAAVNSLQPKGWINRKDPERNQTDFCWFQRFRTTREKQSLQNKSAWIQTSVREKGSCDLWHRANHVSMHQRGFTAADKQEICEGNRTHFLRSQTGNKGGDVQPQPDWQMMKSVVTSQEICHWEGTTEPQKSASFL